MLLIIHNLPTTVRYSEVKALVKEKCNLEEIILDKLVYESNDSRKVTIGLSDDNDALIVYKELDGYIYMGQKLYIEDVRGNKRQTAPRSSNQGQGIWKKFNERSNESSKLQQERFTKEAAPTTSYTSSHINNSSCNLPFYQNSTVTYQSPAGQSNMMQFQTMGSLGISNRALMQNPNMSYSGPNNFDNCPPTMVPPPQQPDFIPFSSDNSQYKPVVKNDNGGRYFQKNINKPFTLESRQNFHEPIHSQSGRNEIMSPSRNDRGNDDHYNRSKFSNERIDVWNRLGDYAERSDVYTKRYNDTNSDNNEKQQRNSYNQSQGENNRIKVWDNQYNFNKQDSFNDNDEDGYSGSSVNNYNRQSSMQTHGKYSRTNDRSFGNDCDSQYDWKYSQNNDEYNCQSFGMSNKKVPVGGYDRDDRTHKSNFYQRQENTNKSKQFSNFRASDFKQPRNVTNTFKQSSKYFNAKPEGNAPIQAVYKHRSLSVKEETWRNQAIAAIAKDLVAAFDVKKFMSEPGFMPYLKYLIRLRIDKITGKREGVTLNQILEEYYQLYPTGSQKSFFIEATKDYPSYKVNKEYKAKDKKLCQQYKNLAQEEYAGGIEYKLEPKLQEAVDKEVKVLVDLFIEECNKNSGGDEVKICQHLIKLSDNFKKVLQLDLTKRILNIDCNLPLRLFVVPKIKTQELIPLLEGLGIVSVRKQAHKKMFVAVCKSYESFDHLCAIENKTINGYTLTFKPLHLAGPIPRRKLNKNKNDEDDDEDVGNEYSDYDDEIDDSNDDGETDDSSDELTLSTKDVVEIKEDENKEPKIDEDPVNICLDKDEATEVATAGSEVDGKVTTVESNNCEENSETVNLTNQDIDVTDITQDDLEDF
ncbi:general transcriptional corepressor trfA-like isoform X2 [Battus philenor]|uniref:general transcriptional corepressor trfA-like isoform X2 n=1 Tax=Battus philenor TaxID=42288 RepID=UPI0035CFB421